MSIGETKVKQQEWECGFFFAKMVFMLQHFNKILKLGFFCNLLNDERRNFQK